jgi:hypothetical protein
LLCVFKWSRGVCGVGVTYGSRRQYLQVDRPVAQLALDSLVDHKKVHLYTLQHK